MKKLFIAFVLFSCCSFSQTISDVQALATVAASTQTVLQQVTGTDGTVCTLAKVANPTIYAYFACTNGGNLLKTVQLLSSGTSTTYWPLGQGTQLWYVFANPTSAAVSFGSFGSAPASGIAWSAINGLNGTVVSGTKTWP